MGFEVLGLEMLGDMGYSSKHNPPVCASKQAYHVIISIPGFLQIEAIADQTP